MGRGAIAGQCDTGPVHHPKKKNDSLKTPFAPTTFGAKWSDTEPAISAAIRQFKARRSGRHCPNSAAATISFPKPDTSREGVRLLLRGFVEFAKANQDTDLVVAGPDQVGLVPELRAIARDAGIEHRVHFPGMLAGDAKAGAFRGAQAFVLPSHQENFGIVVAEAMACETPVLISDKVQIWREVEERRCRPDRTRYAGRRERTVRPVRKAARHGSRSDGQGRTGQLPETISCRSGRTQPDARRRKPSAEMTGRDENAVAM